MFGIRLRNWLLLVVPFTRLVLFSDQLCSSAVRNAYSALPLAILIRKMTFRNHVHYLADTTQGIDWTGGDFFALLSYVRSIEALAGWQAEVYYGAAYWKNECVCGAG
ncbi:hypothetical protein [Rubritalea tangerina]|uniref:hypothetical protein n=1 Tax=Rubritalea tangerina TaxID=430798 RepID=UPI003619CB42